MLRKPHVPTWLLVMVGVTLALGAVSAGLPALTSSPLTTERGEIRVYFDVFEEMNLPTWWATTVLVLAATACAVVAAVSGPGRPRRRWTALTAIVVALSLDEATALHERLDRLVAGRVDLGGFPFLWLLPGAAVGLLLLVAVVSLLRSAPRPTRRWLLTGFGLLLWSALGMESVQGLLIAEGSSGPGYVLAYHVEEAGETLGAIAILAGALRSLTLDRPAPRVLHVGLRTAGHPPRPGAAPHAEVEPHLSGHGSGSPGAVGRR